MFGTTLVFTVVQFRGIYNFWFIPWREKKNQHKFVKLDIEDQLGKELEEWEPIIYESPGVELDPDYIIVGNVDNGKAINSTLLGILHEKI